MVKLKTYAHGLTSSQARALCDAISNAHAPRRRDLDDALAPAGAADAPASGPAAEEDLDVHNVALLRLGALLDVLALCEDEVPRLQLLVTVVPHRQQVEPVARSRSVFPKLRMALEPRIGHVGLIPGTDGETEILLEISQHSSYQATAVEEQGRAVMWRIWFMISFCVRYSIIALASLNKA
jgi:hypothetical protein